MQNYTFGDLVSQHLARKRLSQNQLALGIGLAASIISGMCTSDKNLRGTKLRERVVKIIAWLQEEGALSSLEEANALLATAGLIGLTVKDGESLNKPKLYELLNPTSTSFDIKPSSTHPSLSNLESITVETELTKTDLDKDQDILYKTAPMMVSTEPLIIALDQQLESNTLPKDLTFSHHTSGSQITIMPFIGITLLMIIILTWGITGLGNNDGNQRGLSTNPTTITKTPDKGAIHVLPTPSLELSPSNDLDGNDSLFMPTLTPPISTSLMLPRCGISPPILDTTLPDDRFLRHQGVSIFTPTNTQGGVQSTFVRAAAIDSRGLWFGMFHTDGNPGGVGFSVYDRPTTKRYWIQCDHPDGPHGKDINALVIDHNGNVWAGAERGGLFRFDDAEWTHYGVPDLPNDEIFGLYVDAQGILWVGTWEGIAKFDGTRWTIPYRASELSIFDNHVHAFAVDEDQNIWIGHVDAGISRFTNSTGQWTHIVTATSAIGGNLIRSMVVQPATDHEPESVWVATQDGGVSRFQRGTWTVYDIEDGLPSNNIQAIALDSLNRLWVGTTGGVSYFDGERWMAYHQLDTRTLAIGQACEGCPFDSDHIWTGTITTGLTHSRLPFPDQAFAVAELCIELVPQRSRTCEPSPPVIELLTTDVITVTYPKPLSPGQQLVLGVTMIPQSPYQIAAGREFLSNTNADNQLLFGAHHRTTATANADPGQPYTFMDYSEPWTMPVPEDGTNEQTFTSSWRVWSRTRYAGPTIHVVVTVKR